MEISHHNAAIPAAIPNPGHRGASARPRRLGLLAGGAHREDLGRQRIQLDEDDRELAVLARGQIDLATQLILEVRARVQPGGRVAQALVGHFQAQLLIGALLLLELLQCRAQLQVLLPLRRLVGPDAAQPAIGLSVGIDGKAQHRVVVALASPLEAVLAGQRLRLAQCRLLSRAPGGDQRRVDELRIAVSADLRRGPPQEAGHRIVDVGIAAAGGVLDGQHRALPRGPRFAQRRQHRAEARLGRIAALELGG